MGLKELENWFDRQSSEIQFLIVISPLLFMATVLIIVALIFG